MVKQGRGKVINMASIFGVCGGPLQSAYASSKGGIVQLTKCLALEWAPHNVQVNTLAPGYHMTMGPIAKQYLETTQGKAMIDAILGKIPQGRVAHASEIIGPAVFLASDASNFTTGAVLVTEAAREGEAAVIAFSLTPAGVWFGRLVFSLLLALGLPGYAFLAWSQGLTIKGMTESDPARASSLLARSARFSLGNAQHFKSLATNYYSVFKRTQNIQDLERALKAVEAGLKLNPVDPELHRLRAQYFLSFYLLSERGDFLDLAERSFERAYALSPRDVDVRIGLAWSSYFRGDRETEARRWREVLELEPYDLMSRVYLARALLALGQTEEAREEWRRFLSLRREVQARAEAYPPAFRTVYRSKRVQVDEAEVSAVGEMLKRTP
jgi:hypothetical protein